MAKKPAKKRICFFAMLVVAMLAAGYCVILPRTLFDEPFSATVWSRYQWLCLIMVKSGKGES